jgi:subfamily B ATP-binding cassette protein MsbA
MALVGPSGAGKSTIADLIPRFYDVEEGEILIDGINIKDLSIERLRSLLGIVTQESILFNDSIFNNIAFGDTDALPEKVHSAAKVANAQDFIIQSEKGYETVIGDRGVKLSGGQRQRLNIARAIFRNPDILILDEATSALDTESEKLVQDALFNLMQNRTSIVIAHRLSTVVHADIILVLDNGRIIENGTHNELIQQDSGLYKRLYALQQSPTPILT